MINKTYFEGQLKTLRDETNKLREAYRKIEDNIREVRQSLANAGIAVDNITRELQGEYDKSQS